MLIPVAGPAYKHPSIDVAYQRCVNLFPTTTSPVKDDKEQKLVLLPTSGSIELVDLGSDACRCLANFGDYIYAVVGATVYKLTVNELSGTVDATATLGTIGTTSGTVYAASNPTQIAFVDGSATGYIYTPGTGVFATIDSTDSDFPGGVNIKFIDGYFIVAAPNTGNLWTSALNNGNSWDPLDIATAESSTDNIISLGVSKGELWVLGTDSVEIWYNAANVSGSPFSPRTALTIRIGCGAANSVVESSDLLTWLDNRGFIVQSTVSSFIRDNNSGYDLTIISDESITAEILSYPVWNDAIACNFNDKRGHLMYQITFPTAKKTWVYDYTTKLWHERAYYYAFDNELQHHLCQYYTKLRSLHLTAGIRNGIIYVATPDSYDDAGVNIRRIRTLPPFMDPESRGLISIDRVDLRCETGNSPQNGEGSDPYIDLRYSVDGGHTWSDYMRRSMGKVGEYAKPIPWNRLGYGREWVFEFSLSEPIKFSIIDAHVLVSEVEK